VESPVAGFGRFADSYRGLPYAPTREAQAARRPAIMGLPQRLELERDRQAGGLRRHLSTERSCASGLAAGPRPSTHSLGTRPTDSGATAAPPNFGRTGRRPKGAWPLPPRIQSEKSASAGAPELQRGASRRPGHGELGPYHHVRSGPRPAVATARRSPANSVIVNLARHRLARRTAARRLAWRPPRKSRCHPPRCFRASVVLDRSPRRYDPVTENGAAR
jgi:hypothetical protein